MSKESQIKHQQTGLEEGTILPLKSVFPWTKTKEIINSQLYKNLQRAVSPQEYYFVGNKNLFIKNDSSHNRKIFELFSDYIVVDKDKLPENFVTLFSLDLNAPDIENQVKKLFQTARLLDRTSARIVFIQDKIIIFRNEEQLSHKTSQKLTQGEKKRSEIVTTFNTFNNMYDAIRSQYYTLQNSQDNQNDCKEYQQDILKLAQEIKLLGIWHTKDSERKRKLDTIIEETQNARNFRVLGANLQNLQNLTFSNASIDSNILEGAKNKFNKRFGDLQNIIGVVNNQLNALENILAEHEFVLDYFVTQIAFANLSLAHENYARAYRQLEQKYGPIAPFSQFFASIQNIKSDLPAMKTLGLEIKDTWEAQKTEHQQKLAGVHTIA